MWTLSVMLSTGKPGYRSGILRSRKHSTNLPVLTSRRNAVTFVQLCCIRLDLKKVEPESRCICEYVQQ